MQVYTVIGIVLIVVIGFLGIENFGLKKQNKNLTQSVGIYQGQIQGLTGDLKAKDEAIALGNARLRALIDRAEDRQKLAEEARLQAREAAKVNRKLSQELLMAKRKTDDICKDADALINEYLEKRKK